MKNSLASALKTLKSADPISDEDLLLCKEHFKALDKPVYSDPALECIRLYVVTNLNRVEDIIKARKS